MSYEGNSQLVKDDRIESLRIILEREQHRSVTYSEAAEIGESLIDFFVVLADETHSSDESTDYEPVAQSMAEQTT